MYIEITEEDFDFLHHTSCKLSDELIDIWRFEHHFGNRFTRYDMETLKSLNKSIYAYWIDGQDNNLQALVAYKLLSKQHKSGLFWDPMPINDKVNDVWGWCVISTRLNEGAS
tara:strand:+ start:290 stop:625 length:336 start_codon:yes stop_codon:yes gene_type:complete